MKTEFVFLASGLMFERVKGNDFTAIEYKNIVNVERQEDTDHFNIWVHDGDSDTDPYLIQCTNAQERINLMGELRKRKAEWLERDAVQREEDNRDVLRAPRSAQIPRPARHCSRISAS